MLLLMTTATYRAGAFLEAATKLGLSVTVGSERPQALASAHPEGNLTVSFVDLREGTRAIVELARGRPLRAIVAADDDGAILAAAASEALELPHSPVAAVSGARNKQRTREILEAAGLESPRFEVFPVDIDAAEASRRVLFPCVVKPLFLSASRGVMRADDAEQLAAALGRLAALLSRPEVSAHGGALARRVLVETFIPGIEVAVEGILTDGRLRVLAIFDKPDPLDGPFFEETIYVTPSRLPAAAQEAIAAETQSAVSALGLFHGPIHAELRVNRNGPSVLEVAPRSIGGLCSRTLRFDGGTSLEELILMNALGRDVSRIERDSLAAGVMMIPIPRAGILRGVTGLEDARTVPGIEDIRISIPLGHEVVPPPDGSRYLGFIFARTEKPEGAETALRDAHRSLAFEISPPATPLR